MEVYPTGCLFNLPFNLSKLLINPTRAPLFTPGSLQWCHGLGHPRYLYANVKGGDGGGDAEVVDRQSLGTVVHWLGKYGQIIVDNWLNLVENYS